VRIALRDSWLVFVFAKIALLSGCAGYVAPCYSPRLDEASVIAMGNSALEKAGYDISHLQSSDIQVQYDAGDCSWAVFYTLHRGELPAGPLLIVYDRTGRVAFTPNM
jgi:hypothetical protein